MASGTSPQPYQVPRRGGTDDPLVWPGCLTGVTSITMRPVPEAARYACLIRFKELTMPGAPDPHPRIAFRQGAAALLAAWRAAGDLTGTIHLPGRGDVPARFPIDQQITEFAVHAWDLATATGQAARLDREIAQAALDWARTAMRPEFRGDEASGMPFGAEIEIAADAPVYDRLAAFFGRNPG